MSHQAYWTDSGSTIAPLNSAAYAVLTASHEYDSASVGRPKKYPYAPRAFSSDRITRTPPITSASTNASTVTVNGFAVVSSSARYRPNDRRPFVPAGSGSAAATFSGTGSVVIGLPLRQSPPCPARGLRR